MVVGWVALDVTAAPARCVVPESDDNYGLGMDCGASARHGTNQTWECRFTGGCMNLGLWGRSFLSIGLLIVSVRAKADDLLIDNMSIEDYVDRAIHVGVQGRENSLALQTAGYTREIAFRQTDSPSLSFSHTHNRTESWQSGISDSVRDVKQSALNLNEVTPLGTAITGSAGYGDGNRPGLSATVTQPLYIFVWNSVLRTRREADLNFANARDNFQSTALSLRTQARSFYYGVMEGEESIQVAQRKLSSSEKLQGVTEALVDAGRLPAVEKMRARIRTQTDVRQVQNALVSRDKAMLSAKNFIYYDLDLPVHFTTRLEFITFQVPLDDLIDYALVHRPILRSLRRNLELAHLATQATQEATRPLLAVNAAYNSAEVPALISRSWTLGGTINWLFFDSFVTNDRVKIARISEFVANLNLSDSERTTRVSVRNAYLDVKSSEKQIVDFATSREQARQNVEILRLRFKNGLEKLTDVFDAENDMRNLDNEYLNLLVAYNLAKDNLSELVGADVDPLQ